MYTLRDAKEVAQILNIEFDQFTIEEFLDGINIELEHGLISPKTNVTNNDLIITAKIALVHLNDYNKEYGLRVFEQFLESNLPAQK